jgi:hypothetical protein
MPPETSSETINVLIWVIGFLVAGYIAMFAFFKWIVGKVLAVTKSATDAIVSTRGSVDKLTAAVNKLTSVIDHEAHEKVKRK